MFPNLDNWVIWLYLSPENNILSFTVPINSLSFHFKCHYSNYYLVHFKSTSYCPVFIKWLSFCPKPFQNLSDGFNISTSLVVRPILIYWLVPFFFPTFGLYSYMACNIFTLRYVSFLFVKCQCAKCKENIFYSHYQCLRFHNLFKIHFWGISIYISLTAWYSEQDIFWYVILQSLYIFSAM